MTKYLDHDWFTRALPANVTIGPRSWCYSSFAFLHYRSRRACGVSIGSDTGIYNGTFFDIGPEGQVAIGDYCTLVGAIISTNGRVEIGDYAFLAHEVVLADEAASAPVSPNWRPKETLNRSIIIGPNSWIGARAVILAGASIGEGAIIGAGTVVTGAVPAFTVAAGNPARIYR